MIGCYILGTSSESDKIDFDGVLYLLHVAWIC